MFITTTTITTNTTTTPTTINVTIIIIIEKKYFPEEFMSDFVKAVRFSPSIKNRFHGSWINYV